MLLRKTIIKTVTEYLKTLPFKIEEAIIFGSSARNERLWNSDIDLIVISPDFEKMKFHKRSFMLLKHWEHKRVPLEVFGYTRHEYEERLNKSLWFKQIDKEGIKIRIDS